MQYSWDTLLTPRYTPHVEALLERCLHARLLERQDPPGVYDPQVRVLSPQRGELLRGDGRGGFELAPLVPLELHGASHIFSASSVKVEEADLLVSRTADQQDWLQSRAVLTGLDAQGCRC